MDKLKLSKRENKSGNNLRKNGKIPGVIYGKKCQNTLFEVGDIELNRCILQEGEHGIIDVNYEGKTYKTLIKEVQKDPINHNIIHIDLENVKSDKNIVNTNIPITFTGQEFIMKKGGIVQKEKSVVKVKCNGENIPKSINIDLSKAKIGKALRISDMEVSKDITFMEDLDTVVASISIS
ncbi:50S ribosomal protein L25/general stress protein Ctc [Clostridium niameyense]|uniref:Large ribosomal subunit protein bL25 n=1 Tax=Clostridium niameyense TaxID=1622073 RepID=A0A6M0RCD3_9CLOT|nr:50S ribosomal protein L25/general stress protein Ctc [Clostridium niameyense]NEZ47916.1 50S ribosomal protein L25/general stress protein Ctc [Clostridium niameyense]